MAIENVELVWNTCLWERGLKQKRNIDVSRKNVEEMHGRNKGISKVKQIARAYLPQGSLLLKAVYELPN